MSSLYRMVQSFPMLDDGEEKTLWDEYFRENTKRSRRKVIRDKIITSHLRLALKGARKWETSKLPISDLFGEAEEGLIKAFDKFSTKHGVKFATYAVWWIRAKVESYVMDNAYSGRVGTTAFSKFLFFNYRKRKNLLQIENPNLDANQLDRMLAQKLIDDGKSPSDDVEKTLALIEEYKMKRTKMSSLDTPLSDEGESASYVDYVPDENAKPVLDIIGDREEALLGLDFLISAKGKLKEREWEILKARRLDEPRKTLEDLSEVYGVSRERVRQIEVKAFDRLKGMAEKHFKENANPVRVIHRKTVKQAVTSLKTTAKIKSKRTLRSQPQNPQVIGKKQFTTSFLNQKLKLTDLLSSFDEDNQVIPLTKGKGEERKILGYFAPIVEASKYDTSQIKLSFSFFKKKSTSYADSEGIVILTGQGINKDKGAVFVPAHLFSEADRAVMTHDRNVNGTRASTGSNQIAPAKQIEKTSVSVPPSKPKDENKVVEEANPSISKDVKKPRVTTDMIKGLRNLDLSIEDAPYIPKSVEFEEMVAAVHEFMLGKREYFERATKVVDGVEHPETGRWVYVGPSVGEPKLRPSPSIVEKWNELVSRKEEMRVVSNDMPEPVQNERKEAPKESLAATVEKDTDQSNQNTENSPSERTNFYFTKTGSVPRKPWTLTLAGDQYHLSNIDKKFVAHLLNSDEPQSKEQILSSGISFHSAAQKKFTDMGLLRVYKKPGVARTTYYGIATENYRPEYDGYDLRVKTTTAKPAVKVVEKEKPVVEEVVENENTLTIGALIIDPSKSVVSYEGQELSHVTSKPYEALVLLSEKHGDFVTKEELSMHFFGNTESQSIDQIERGIKGLGNLIDRTIPSLSQSLIMKVGDKGYALTLSMDDRHVVYEKAGIVNPLKVTKPKFAPPTHHQSNSGKAKDAMNNGAKSKKTPHQTQGSGRRSMAEQLAGFNLTAK